MPSKSPKFATGADTLASCFEPGLGTRPDPAAAFQPTPPMLEQLAALAAAVAIDRWAHPTPPEGLRTRARFQAATLAGLHDWLKAGGFSSEAAGPAHPANPLDLPTQGGSGCMEKSRP